MDVYSHRKQTYKAVLAHQTPRQGSFEQRFLPTQVSLPFYSGDAPPHHEGPATNHHNHVNTSRASAPQHQHNQLQTTYQQRQQQQQYPYQPPSTQFSHGGIPSTTASTANNRTPYYTKVVEPTAPNRSTSDKATRMGFQKWSTWRIPSTASSRTTNSTITTQPPLLLSTTIHLIKTFERRDPKFAYHQKRNPKRILTKPSKPAKNDGYDNEDHDYILHVNDILGEDKNYSYRVIDLLGQGTFGQVVKCEHLSSGKLFSVKVIKNRPAFRTQSCMEVEILKQLNQKMDVNNQHHILRLEHTFNHKNHLCLVFELLSFNLYELIKQNGFKGLSIQLVRNITTQLLETLVFLAEVMIIHCDLKPENILLESVDSPKIKVIDFGSACHKANPGYTYIQSRFYRSPEVLLKCRYTHAIDMWSLGCIVAELFLGIPLFPGANEYDQLGRILDLLGEPTPDLLDRGGNTLLYFDRESIGHNKYQYKRKSRDKYNNDNNKQEMPSKRYFEHKTLSDIIMHANTSSKCPAPGTHAFQLETQMREWLVDFLLNTLTLSPLRRWSPKEALQHSFISGKPPPLDKPPPSDPQQQKLNHERYLYHQRQKEQQQQQQLKHQQEAAQLKKHQQEAAQLKQDARIESFDTSPLVDIASPRRKPADLRVSFAPPISAGALKPALKKTPSGAQFEMKIKAPRQAQEWSYKSLHYLAEHYDQIFG